MFRVKHDQVIQSYPLYLTTSQSNFSIASEYTVIMSTQSNERCMVKNTSLIRYTRSRNVT